jgi:hypothetical protein
MRSASFSARLKKLETARAPTLLFSVAHYNPSTDRIYDLVPSVSQVMLAPRWSSDEAWEVALRKQQAELISVSSASGTS